MSTSRTPRGLRLHIALMGRRNVGKSSLLNALAGQQVSIVSEVAGTTTDPVEKAAELQPVGPVVWIDTAGVDDSGDLGERRIERSWKALEKADLGLLVVDARAWGEPEEAVLAAFAAHDVLPLVVFNKVEEHAPSPSQLRALEARGLACHAVSAATGLGIEALRQALIATVPADWLDSPPLLADLIPPRGVVVLVVPIDLEAPRGRLIQAQVQVLREALDADAIVVTAKQHQLAEALAALTAPPALVVTDSQAFALVDALVPPGVPLTSFSILFARAKGDLAQLALGARAIDGLRPGDRVLVAEACTHHPVGEDIGRVKIPRWLAQKAGGELAVDVVAGSDFPDDLSPYRLVVQCGGCVRTRREMLARLGRCRRAGVPITNYGVAIAWTLGIAERALAPFPTVLEALSAAR